MSRTTKTWLIVFGAVLSVLLGYLVFLMYGRIHSEPDGNDSNSGSVSSWTPPWQESEDEQNGTQQDTEDSDEDTADEEESIEEPEEETSFLDISSADCTKRCAEYDGDDFEYCSEVCGLSATDPGYREENGNGSPETDEPDDCDWKSGLALDYCHKDAAVADSDLSACTGISDPGIRKACHDRIAQDLMESTP